ncbi:MAG: hypothetical protein WC371_00855 [Parachlamydiales bacterium]|jgi:hypothetical protein
MSALSEIRGDSANTLKYEDWISPRRMLKKILLSSTDRKIVSYLIVGGILTTVGMFLLLVLWPFSNLVLTLWGVSHHAFSQIFFHGSYLLLEAGALTILASAVFQVFSWIKEEGEFRL